MTTQLPNASHEAITEFLKLRMEVSFPYRGSHRVMRAKVVLVYDTEWPWWRRVFSAWRQGHGGFAKSGEAG